MNRVFNYIRIFLRRADLVLLGLCVAATLFGMLLISSAARYLGAAHYLSVQAVALALGVIAYVVMTCIDIDVVAERWELLLVLGLAFIGSLYFFGSGEQTTGNRSWLYVRFLGMSVQPAEVCKIFFVIILAKLMSLHQNRLSTPLTVAKLLLVTGLFVLVIRVASYDDGLALSYLAMFVLMALAGGVSLAWFGAGILALAAAIPFVWTNLLDQTQRNRILIIFDPSVDPLAQNARYQMNLCQTALGGGQLTGQGLYHGAQTQSGILTGQHTDYIFTVAGEELGMVGCFCVLALLCAIILRCIWVGAKSGNYMNRMICFGFAMNLLFQVFINVGMCVGVVPIIGLTLPFFSYGGSGIITNFICMGIVSGIRMRPAPDFNVRYLQPPMAPVFR